MSSVISDPKPRPVVHEPPPDPVKVRLHVIEDSVAAAARELRRARDLAEGTPARRAVLRVESVVQQLRLALLDEASD